MILLADDERLGASIAKFRLEKEGFEVSVFENGEGVTEAAAERRPAAVILDVMMPVLDGYATLRKLRERTETKDVPVVMLTARSREEDFMRAQEFGVSGFITKPFSPTELISTIREAIG
ncbi:MAG: response regulator [Ignavibacteriales bacterium]|nr:response regulator [Ignavibacteriales bacterium]